MNPSSTPRRVAVIGGGITGLAAAHRLVELDPAAQVVLFEAGSQVGGILQTVHRDGFLIERSADNFLSSVPWGVDLCRRVGLADQLLSTDEARRQAFVVHRGQLVPVPAGFSLLAPSRLWPMLTTPLLSPAGKLRLAWEYFVPARRTNSDESLATFARRRLGREVFERLVQPLVGGIYTADPERLSVAATMPRFLEMERRHGGLIRGARRNAQQSGNDADASASGARYGLFVAPRDGMASLVAAIAARLPGNCIQLNTTITKIEQLPDYCWQLVVFDRDEQHNETFDELIVAAPANVAARLLADTDKQLAADLGSIEHASSAVVSLGYRREQIAHPLDGFGFVVPAIERRKILAGSFASAKFPGRAPDGSVLVRVFLGGALQPEVLEQSDESLQRLAITELVELLGIRGEPVLSELARWPNAMPQYHVGHCELVARVESCAAAIKNFAVAGNAFHGVGVPNCIRSGELAAERIISVGQGLP